MNLTYDVVIAGAGLAGACAALYLSPTEKVLVLDAATPASGASGAAAGLVNPFMGRKAKPVWRKTEALPAFLETLRLADAEKLFANTGIVRPARSTQQAQVFAEAATQHPSVLSWLSAAHMQSHYPMVDASFGALLVREGSALSVPAYVNALLDQAVRQGAELRTHSALQSWQETPAHVTVTMHTPQGMQTIQTKRLLLALGYGYTAHSSLKALNLHGVKGQVIRVPIPLALRDMTLPILSGTGYIVPDEDTLILGSSHEHSFSNLEPSAEQSEYILNNVAAMLPTLSESQPLSATAGVRITVPKTRLPMLGPLPGDKRTWIFTGLGTKGLLMAPLLARQLPHYLLHPTDLPEVVHPH